MGSAPAGAVWAGHRKCLLQGSGRHPPTPERQERANQQAPRVPPGAFRDFWGTAVETPGWGWTEGEGVSLPFWPGLPAPHSKSHGAMWLLSIPCILPFQVA